MDVTNIDVKTLPEAWYRCIRGLMVTHPLSYTGQRMPGVHQYVIDRGSFEGHQRIEYDFVVVRIEYPGSRPMVPDVPAGIPVPTTQDYIDGYIPYLMTGERKEGEQYTYGEDLESQIPEVISMYVNGGANTNQAFMTVGNRSSIKLKDPQCLRMIDTRIQDGKLHFIVYFRSWDLWGGFPANLGGIQILKEYMASEIGVGDGELIACSKGLHLYDYCWDYARAVLHIDVGSRDTTDDAHA
jgi:thymidylate synthase